MIGHDPGARENGSRTECHGVVETRAFTTPRHDIPTSLPIGDYLTAFKTMSMSSLPMLGRNSS